MKNNNTEEMKIDVNNEFVKAVLKSTYQYIIDEINGYSNADIRLSKKIAAAKLTSVRRKKMMNETIPPTTLTA